MYAEMKKCAIRQKYVKEIHKQGAHKLFKKHWIDIISSIKKFL